jgi:hypothetical protein
MSIRRARHLFVTAALASTLAACGGTAADDGGAATPGPAGGDPPVLVISDGGGNEPGLTVGEALDHQATDDLVSVTGALFIGADGGALLCEAIAESFPPQCGGERLTVEGLDPAAVAGLQTEGDVSWSDSVTLFGSVE